MFAQEPHVRGLDVEEVDVPVELLDDVIEPEAADPLVGRCGGAGLGSHRPGVEVGLADRGGGVAGLLEAAGEGVPFGLAVAGEVSEHPVVARVAAGQ